MQKEDDEGEDRAREEAVRERLEDVHLEQARGADHDVLRAGGEGLGKHLSGPDFGGVVDVAVQVVAFGAQDPTHRGVVEGDPDQHAPDLGDEDAALGDVHVVADFLVLQHVLGPVPDVASDGAVRGGADGIAVRAPLDAFDHGAVDEFVERADGKLVVGHGVEPAEGNDGEGTYD